MPSVLRLLRISATEINIMKSILTIGIAAIMAATTMQAHAANLCYERDQVVGSIKVDEYGPIKIVVGSTTGKDGWDGVGGKCTKPGSARTWVGPRDAKGVCMTPASIVGTTAGPVYGTKIGVIGSRDEDVIEQQRRYGVFVTIRGTTRFIGTSWREGSC
jgi:hypothetical protein